MPLEEINRLAKGVFLGSNHTSRDLEKYLESVLKRGKYYKKYKDLPGKFALALERCLSTKLEDNMIWIYEPKGDKDRCIRQLPPAIAEPFSELFTKLPKCSNVHNREQKIDIPDYKRIRELIPGKELIMEVENAWLAEGYPATMLRRWLRYKTINLAPWFRDKVETIVDIILHISPTESQPTNTETQFEKPYPWFKMLRGTLPNKNKVQLIIIPPKRKYRKRESGILSTVFSFYATHPMAFINGVIGGHIYHEPTSQEISWKLDFTDDLRQKHADESIVKMKERGWKFKDMDKHVRGRSILDGKTTQLTEYENIYKSALKHVGKGNEELPAMLDNYFRERLRAVETYTWLEENGRITEVNNVAERRLISPKSRGLLSKWVHDKLSGHVDVIPKDQWGARKLVRAKLDLWFGGYQQDRKDKLCHLL
ncbi:hypothetical protein E8E11_001313 [Didymella keratinophila]|nr:hypothetical protein E8E11_001313 [Didymella keratinophila]